MVKPQKNCSPVSARGAATTELAPNVNAAAMAALKRRAGTRGRGIFPMIASRLGNLRARDARAGPERGRRRPVLMNVTFSVGRSK
jgi:hypothetical protein